MNPIFLLIRNLTVCFYAQKLGDKELLNETISLAEDIPDIKTSIVMVDKKANGRLRDIIRWVSEQPIDKPIMKSIFTMKISEFLLSYPELEDTFNGLFDEEDRTNISELVYQNIKEIRRSLASNKTNLKLKDLLKPLIFNGEEDLSKEDWLKLADLLEHKLGGFNEDVDKAVMEEVSLSQRDAMTTILNDLHIDMSPEGILKCGLQGINESLYPDMGFRRKMFYLILALTNRGKSFFLAHLLTSFVLYNKPLVKDISRRPTIFFCSAEDSMGLVLKRMFEIFVTAKTGLKPDFFSFSADEVTNTIINTFQENGWDFCFYRIDPTHESIRELKQRVRNLEKRGHEIIVAAYDYLGMMNLDGCYGESRTDKLQDLFRQTRNFFIARNSMFFTPHQLNPKAKDILRENDDESEINFVREVGGHSMTEGSTKITNEVDYELTIHIAKLMGGRNFLTWYLGKGRGDEGATQVNRGGMYELESGPGGRGLIHDILADKPGYIRSLRTNVLLEQELSEL